MKSARDPHFPPRRGMASAPLARGGSALQAGKGAAFARAVAVIRLCARRSQGASFSEIRAALGDGVASTVIRLIRTLCAEDFLERLPNGRYRLASGALLLARQIQGTASRRDHIQPWCERLAEQTGESVLVVEYDGEGMVRLAKCERPEAIHYGNLGERLPLTRHALGLCILAFLSPEEQERHLAQGGERCDRQLLANDLRHLAENGHIVRSERHLHYPAGVHRIAAPLYDAEGICGAIGIMVFAGTRTSEQLEQLRQAVVSTAQTLSQTL